MAKPRKKTIVKHCMLWSIWYLINTLQIADGISTFKTTEWLQLAYNYSSLVIVFYCITSCMTRFCKIFSLNVYSSLKGVRQVRYLFNNALLIALTVIAVYVSLSVTLDNGFFGYKYPTALSHIIQRLTRVLPYAVLAAGYAYFGHYKSSVKKYIRKNDRRFKMVKADNLKVKALIREYYDAKSLN
jgi:hypothetical protein